MNSEQLFEEILFESNLKPSFEQILREEHLREMSDTNPDKTAKDLKSKYNLYKYECTSEKELAQKVIDKYSEITAGSEVEYKPYLSNNSPVTNSKEADQFFDEVIARLQKLIKATGNFYVELKKIFLNWWESLNIHK